MDMLQTVNRAYSVLYLLGDIKLDLFRRGSRIYRCNSNVGDIEFRHVVQPDFPVGIEAGERQRNEKRRDRNGSPHRKVA